MKAYAEHQYTSYVDLTAGQQSYFVQNFNMGGKPIGARGDIMNGGSNQSIILAAADLTTLNPTGGNFNFTAPIPSSGRYRLVYTFYV